MSTETPDTIWIITETSEIPVTEEPTSVKDSTQDTGGSLHQPQPPTSKTARSPRRGVPVSAQKLKGEMAKFVQVVG